jgi:hypothetical protein
VSAGARPGSYTRRISPEHEFLAQWLQKDPKYRERILEDAAVNETMGRFLHHRHPPLWSLARRTLLRPIYSLLTRMGIHPFCLPMAIAHGRRGGYIRYPGRITGAR